MIYLVLGSAGQIGSHLVEYLKNQGEKVYEIDILNNEWEDLRIQNNMVLDEYLLEADIVYFLAFDVGGAKYLRTISRYKRVYNEQYENNVKYI
jgi:nucleoside-diphosphate-sugar epimerase